MQIQAYPRSTVQAVIALSARTHGTAAPAVCCEKVQFARDRKAYVGQKSVDDLNPRILAFLKSKGLGFRQALHFLVIMAKKVELVQHGNKHGCAGVRIPYVESRELMRDFKEHVFPYNSRKHYAPIMKEMFAGAITPKQLRFKIQNLFRNGKYDFSIEQILKLRESSTACPNSCLGLSKEQLIWLSFMAPSLQEKFAEWGKPITH